MKKGKVSRLADGGGKKWDSLARLTQYITQLIRSPDLDTRVHLSSTSPLVMKLYKQAIEDGTLLLQLSAVPLSQHTVSESLATAESSTTI